MMADAGEGPHVVHGPYDPLAASQDASDLGEREHGLIGPMEMDNVGFKELGQAGDVSAVAGGVDGKEAFARETVGGKDFSPFGHELEFQPHRRPEADHVGAVSGQRAVAAEQRGIHPALAQRLEQPKGGYGGATGMVGSVDKQYFHADGGGD